MVGTAIAVGCHLLLLIGIILTPQPPRLLISDDEGVTVGLVRSRALTKTAPDAPAQTPKSPPKSSPDKPAQSARADDAPRPSADPVVQPHLAAIDLTAEPVALLTPAAPQPAAETPQPAAYDDSGMDCDPTGHLLAALQDNILVRNELAQIPRQDRSVANAIMLWDGQWANIHGSAAPIQPSAIRQTITDVIHAMPPNCQGQQVDGPRLLPVSDSNGATVLAVGSGAWKWSDLLQTH